MDLPMAVGLLTHAIEKEDENYIFSMWNGLHPFMQIGWISPISFNEYKDKASKPHPKATSKTSEEIVTEMMPLIMAHEGKK